MALTAYDAVMGRMVCDAGVDFILVGDSVGTTLLGHKTTIPVDMIDMVRHTAAVRRHSQIVYWLRTFLLGGKFFFRPPVGICPEVDAGGRSGCGEN